MKQALIAGLALASALGAGWSLAASDAEPDPSAGIVFRVPVEGTIDLGLAPMITRILDEAGRSGARAVLLDIDTFGGRLDAAVRIRDAVIEASVPTIAFVNPRAISAGALISLGCTTIAMRPGGSIGAATPVTGAGTGKMEAAGEKVISYMRAEMRATAERRGRPGDLAAAMVDPDVEVEGVIEKGKLLTLTTSQALSLSVADFEATRIDDVLEQAGLAGATVVERGLNWAEELARAISNPILTSMLLSIGFLGIILELYQPGWGVPGTLGALALVLFFFGHYVVYLAGVEEIALVGVGLLLLALEFFVIPGFGVAGVAGAVAILAGIILAMLDLDWRIAWELGLLGRAVTVVAVVLLVVTGAAFVALRFLPRSTAVRPFILGEELESAEGYTSHHDELVVELPRGTEAITIGDLRPSGVIRAGGRRIDAVSEGGYIDKDTAVVIVGWRAGSAVVKPKE